MQDEFVVVDVIGFGRMKLDDPTVVGKEGVFDPAHDGPTGEHFSLSVGDTRVAPAPPVTEPDVPDFAIQRDQKIAVPTIELRAGVFASFDAPTFSSAQFLDGSQKRSYHLGFSWV